MANPSLSTKELGDRLNTGITADSGMVNRQFKE